MISPIAPADVPEVWPGIQDRIADVLAIRHERTADDLLRALLAGRAELWHMHDPGDAWLVVEPHKMHRRKAAQISIAVGTFPFASIDDLRPAMDAWAIAHGCDEVRLRVRPGWMRFLPDFHREIILTHAVPVTP